MKSADFTSYQPKMSPYLNNMPLLVNEARDSVDSDVVDVRQVPISKILFTHPIEKAHDDREFSRHDALPFAVLLDGYYHLLDGHGHIMDAINEGFSKTLLFVADGDNEELTEAKKKKKSSNSSTHTPVVPFYGRWWYGGTDNDNLDQDSDNDLGTGELDLVNGDVGGDGGGE
ncbi:MAG: hypothetical protein M0R77_02640 [Gammaproteobacteria bacterium]|nr:hypothetical protein [Gammaproteobacteria bacterium]